MRKKAIETTTQPLETFEMAALIDDCSEEILELCIKSGYISPEVNAAPTTVSAGNSTTAEEARLSMLRGEPYQAPRRSITAEERFLQFWKSPAGRPRIMSSRVIREMLNKVNGRELNATSPMIDRNVETLLSTT